MEDKVCLFGLLGNNNHSYCRLWRFDSSKWSRSHNNCNIV